MKRSVPIPVLIVVGVVLLVAIIGYGFRTLGVSHGSANPPITKEQRQAQARKAYGVQMQYQNQGAQPAGQVSR